MELSALRFGEGREQLALSLRGRGGGLPEALDPRRGQLDQLPAAIERIALASDQPVSLKLVQEGNEVRGVKPQSATEFAAVDRPALLEAMQDRELVRAHAELLQRTSQGMSGHPGHPGEQDPAPRAGRRLLGTRCRRAAHRKSV